MSVLIKGMEMPKHCLYCPLRNDEDDCAVQELQNWRDWDDMKAGCPLVEVPASHGRLIDADALMESFVGFTEAGIDGINDKISDAPTIDAVEVVRCKDCRRWCICRHGDDWFCADGERRSE